MVAAANSSINGTPTRKHGMLRTLLAAGVLPWLVALAVCFFSIGSDAFLTQQNLLNLVRQASYLTLVSIGQFLVIITAGLDLSVGVMLAICSVVAATVMSYWPDGLAGSIWLVIGFGCLAAMGAALIIGIVNGIGIAVLNVNPFMMTLAMSSIGFGIALMMTGGVPVYGIPSAFSDVFGFGTALGIPTPILVTIGFIALVHFLLQHMHVGRYLYAIGSNPRAASLSGINVAFYTFLAYSLCALLASVAALLLTARLESGEANLGASMPLQSIAACVVGGVSLTGGVGKLRDVVLGAIFITLVQNGLNLMGMDSYVQMVVIGCLLVLAIVFDNLRRRLELSA
ncbi:ABC transporter permease [Corticibacterium sp. UT-5YL-CI-8]|nr:ABC transporter permease [Tianweitania sp. UT-5YL-CI-8]